MLELRPCLREWLRGDCRMHRTALSPLFDHHSTSRTTKTTMKEYRRLKSPSFRNHLLRPPSLLHPISSTTTSSRPFPSLLISHNFPSVLFRSAIGPRRTRWNGETRTTHRRRSHLTRILRLVSPKHRLPPTPLLPSRYQKAGRMTTTILTTSRGLLYLPVCLRQTREDDSSTKSWR